MIVAGFGFRSDASVDSLRDAMCKAILVTGQHPEALATVTDKSQTTTFARFARSEGLPVVAVNADVMLEQKTTTHSAASQNARQTGSLAEATALAAAGANAQLLHIRLISKDRQATCALASGDDT